jgi:hypothetical protein
MEIAIKKLASISRPSKIRKKEHTPRGSNYGNNKNNRNSVKKCLKNRTFFGFYDAMFLGIQAIFSTFGFKIAEDIGKKQFHG